MTVWINGIGFLVCPKNDGRPPQFLIVDQLATVLRKQSNFVSSCCGEARTHGLPRSGQSSLT
jgi:hypothetical protein